MSPSIEEQIEGLKRAIADMENQREFLGDEVVDAGLVPFRRKLNELTAQLTAHDETLPQVAAQQRKLVTLLFMDIAGSTSIAEHMDPEDVSEVFDNALKKLALPVEEHGGRVTRFMGDGFLAVFGAPTAREDDPEQAVRAGLRILSLASQSAAELEKAWDIQGFNVRVGVNTGLVMLGGETEAENTLMGAAVNLAARLESAAPAGGMLISHDTYRHIRGVFDVEAWEPLQMKGFAEPVQVYRILSARPRAFRLYSRGVEGVETRMVGRESELKVLQDLLLSAIEENEGQMVTIIGEAGVGKSRLLYEFQNWIELLPSPAVLFYEGRGHQETQGIPYGLLRDLFEFRFQILEDDSKEVAREKIQSGFGDVFGSDDESLMRSHTLGQLLGYDFSASPHLTGMLNDAEQLCNRGLIYLGEYLREVSAQNPVVIFLEDIHWADDSTLDALNWLGERMHRQRLLVVCTTRQSLFERRPYWGEGVSFHRRINLEPLTRRESRQLVADILKLADQVPPKLSEMVVEGAEGNPFYLEELVKMLVENGVIIKGGEHWHIEVERLAQLEVPPTLSGVLQARLDSLSPEERAILQQASVVGRHFWDRLVAHIQIAGDGIEEIISDTLLSLRQRELIYRREESAFAEANEYIFKHDILREVTYESVLKRLRRVYHGLVADWLIAQVADRAGEYSGMIARHLLLGERKEQAGVYYLQAGEAALLSFANHEAETYFRQSLELLVTDNQMAACLRGLGEALDRQGAKQEAIEIFQQGIDTILKLGDSNSAADLYTRLARVLWWVDYERSWSICQEGLTRIEGRPESPGMALLLAETGRTAWFQAKPAEKIIAYCQRAIEIAERQDAQEARADAIITIALTINDPDRSIALLQEAVTISEANELWRLSNRAHTSIAYFLSEFYLSLESAYNHDRKAAEIAKRIGDIELLFLSLENVVDSLVGMGRLNSALDTVADILQDFPAPRARIEEFLEKHRPTLLYPRGEWSQALELFRQQLGELRETGRIAYISNANRTVADSCLELNRFAGMDYLYEAEAALLENVQMKWQEERNRFLMVMLLSRQGRLTEAHEWLAEVLNLLDQPISKELEEFRLQAEAELAFAEGSWEEAAAKDQALIDIYQVSGHRWRWARHLIDLGDVLVSRAGPGDLEQAGEAFRQSLDMFKEMGAPGYIRVLEQRLGNS